MRKVSSLCRQQSHALTTIEEHINSIKWNGCQSMAERGDQFISVFKTDAKADQIPFDSECLRLIRLAILIMSRILSV
jgi:hypothetical protein